MGLTNGTWLIASWFIIFAQIMYGKHTRAAIKAYEKKEEDVAEIRELVDKVVEDNRKLQSLVDFYTTSAPIGTREPSSSDLLAEVPSQDDEAKID